jgi:hypothetical protein
MKPMKPIDRALRINPNARALRILLHRAIYACWQGDAESYVILRRAAERLYKSYPDACFLLWWSFNDWRSSVGLDARF